MLQQSRSTYWRNMAESWYEQQENHVWICLISIPFFSSWWELWKLWALQPWSLWNPECSRTKLVCSCPKIHITKGLLLLLTCMTALCKSSFLKYLSLVDLTQNSLMGKTLSIAFIENNVKSLGSVKKKKKKKRREKKEKDHLCCNENGIYRYGVGRIKRCQIIEDWEWIIIFQNVDIILYPESSFSEVGHEDKKERESNWK